jgi:carbamoyl-phosphate synthase small subunit
MVDSRFKPGVLVLEGGMEFPGFLFGAEVTAETIRERQRNSSATRIKDRGYGEVVFNTSLTGYQEILTDPSYYGQIVCMTTPHIGNTGVNTEDPESAHPWCAGFVVYDSSEFASNWRSENPLEKYLKENEIPGIFGVDTRALTRHLRTTGVIRGVILPANERYLAPGLLAELPRFEGRDLIGEVSTPEPYLWKNFSRKAGAFEELQPAVAKYKVVAMDFGLKWNLLRGLEHFGCDVEVVPASMSAEDIMKKRPDGVFLSNGPGDPSAAPYAAETIRKLVGKTPIFGVCMGHQLLALAMGGKTYKLKFGHRGGNQPVIDKDTGKVEISSHNHGYSVEIASLPSNVEVTHTNLNDKTCEGLRVTNLGDAQAFSVQYHPEACPGPHDSVILFERFVKIMEANAQ